MCIYDLLHFRNALYIERSKANIKYDRGRYKSKVMRNRMSEEEEECLERWIWNPRDLLVFFFASEGQKWNWTRVENIACTCNLWFVTLARCALSRALLRVWQSERARVFLLAKILTRTPHFFLSLPLLHFLQRGSFSLVQGWNNATSWPLPFVFRSIDRCGWFLVVPVLSLSLCLSILYYAFFFVHNASCVWTGEVINPRLSESIHRHRRCRTGRDKRLVAMGNMVLFVANCWLTNEVVI